MKNLKIRVANKAESKEAQELLDILGYSKGAFENKSTPCWIAICDGLTYSDYNIGKNIWYTACPKEITLQELRDMVNQDQDEPFLTPETTLNDQYAEIEHVRQNVFKATDFGVSGLPEFKHDFVNHPKHYCDHPSGIECIEITRHHDFAIGNAIKYLWRAGLKDSDNEIQDLKKAVWYIQDKIAQLENK